MRPTYPIICALIEPEAPEDSVVVRRAQNGRIRTYGMADYSDHNATHTHFMVKRETVDLVLAFWRRNQNKQFNLPTELGENWIASFRGRPRPFREEDHGPWWNLEVRLIRYDPTEGGL